MMKAPPPKTFDYGVWDLSHLFHRFVHENVPDLEDNGYTNFALLRHQMLMSIIAGRKHHGVKQVILACDSTSGYWRATEYPHYKGYRAIQRKESAIPWKVVNDFFKEFKQEVREHFPWRVIEIPQAEADDVIATICIRWGVDKNILIVGSDGDFVQLHRYPGVYQYDPIKREYLLDKDPEVELQKKILQGESKTGDGIGNVMMSMDECHDWLFNGVRKKPFGEKAAEKVLTQGVPEWLKEQEEGIQENYTRNEKLVDLRYVPEELMREILSSFRLEVSNKNTMALLEYLGSMRLRVIAENIAFI